jgi:TolB-like protein/Tfp pilus assembly protein PilF
MPKKLSQFWQELKRRNVVRVITVYAGAAFVIIELINNITEPLHLPEWTPTLVIVLLAIGFPVAIIFSWIYDVHPEGGMVKTEPADKVKAEDIPKKSSGWKIASYISFVVIVGLIVLNIIPRTGKKKVPDKSIAVLPFRNDSPEQTEMYFIDGTMESILDNLCKIEDIRVVSRTSVEQYRNNPKPISIVGEEMNVSYIIEGSGLKHEDNIRLTIQLIDAVNDKHLWSHTYNRKVQDIFELQSDIAKLVAKEIEVVVTPEEKRRIETVPTRNMDAYDYYLLGQHYAKNYQIDENLWKAIDYYQLAIDSDSTFAPAYSGIANVNLWFYNLALIPVSEVYPKAKAYIQKALNIDEESSIAHSLLGKIKSDFEYDFLGAEREYIRALDINPNDLNAHISYSGYLSLMGRHDEAISQYDIAISLDPRYSTKLSKHYILFQAGYTNEALKLAEEARDTDPDNPYVYWQCAVYYTSLGMNNEAISMLQTQIPLMSDNNISDEIGLLGYNYGQLGQKDKAVEQLDRLDELYTEGIYVSSRALIWAYLGLNDVDSAIEILEKSVADRSIEPRIFPRLSHFNIQNDPRFIELRKKVGL